MQKPERTNEGDVLLAAQWLYQHTQDQGFLTFLQGAPMLSAVFNFNKVMEAFEE